MSEQSLKDRIESLAGEFTLPAHLASLHDSMPDYARFEAVMTKGIAALLGYRPEAIIYGALVSSPTRDTSFEFDAIVIEKSIAQLVIEIKFAAPKLIPVHELASGQRRSLSYLAERNLKAASARASVAVNPLEIFAINANGESCRFKLAEPAAVAEARLLEIAGPKEDGTWATPYIPEPVQPLLESYLAKIEAAETNDQKKKSLENFAQFLLGSTPGVKVKYTDARTETSEIDIICEVDPRTAPLHLSQFGRFFLVECKNWSKPVGAHAARDFIGKLQACKCKLGLLFSRNGITGPDAASDARGEILGWHHREGGMLVVISERDWQAIDKPENFSDWLDRAIDAAHFRFKA